MEFPPASEQSPHAPAETEARLLPRLARLAVREPLTARVQAEPGARLSRLAAEAPAKEALPATVRVRPERFASEADDPFEMLKFPPDVVAMFRPPKSRVPAVCENARQERS